jgi:predicted transcriptional regulator
MENDQSLPDAELEVLASLWQSGEATARQVRERLQAFRPLTHSAVCTLLTRLQDKGLIARRKGPIGKAFLYWAVERPKRTRRKLIGDLLERIFGGDHLAVVSSLFETRPPNAAEIEKLQGLLDQLRASAPSSETRRPRKRKRK